MAKKVASMNFYVNLQHKARKYNKAKNFVTYLKGKEAEILLIIPKVEKILCQLRFNDDVAEEIIF
jgi:hypothetical protein